MSFENLNLHPQLLKALEACGFTSPTEIQQRAVPVVLAGRDLMASAQTGTGKTAAFVLPALQRLLTNPAASGHGPRVLVLTPTRELAAQVEANIAQLARFARIRSGSVVGGVPYPPQMRLLSQPLDLLVATPGRLMDHMERGRVDFSRLEILVLDEADRMLDMGFVDAVNDIAAATPANRQTLLFSATLEGRVNQVAQRLLRDPERIQLSAAQVQHASIEQLLHMADNISHKHRLLTHYLADPGVTQAVIFTATKRGADQLAETLNGQGHTSAALHGDMNQRQRDRTVDQMRRGHVRLLVATDVAARGLDIRGVTHVINFDLPMVAEDYVHRIGRTGRGGASGTAISLVGPDDRRKLSGIERLTGQRLPRAIISGIEPTRSERDTRPGTRGDGGKPAHWNKPGGNRSSSGRAAPRGRSDSAGARPSWTDKPAVGGSPWRSRASGN